MRRRVSLAVGVGSGGEIDVSPSPETPLAGTRRVPWGEAKGAALRSSAEAESGEDRADRRRRQGNDTCDHRLHDVRDR
jgi:hypothetical protein